MKPIVMVTKTNALVADLVHLPDDRALLAAAADDVVERADEDRVELPGGAREVERGRAELGGDALLRACLRPLPGPPWAPVIRAGR